MAKSVKITVKNSKTGKEVNNRSQTYKDGTKDWMRKTDWADPKNKGKSPTEQGKKDAQKWLKVNEMAAKKKAAKKK